MVGCSLAIAARSCSGSAAGSRRTSPSARRWGSRCCTRGRTGSRAALRGRGPRGRHRSGARRRCGSTAAGCRCTACCAAPGWRVEHHDRGERPARAGVRLRRRRGVMAAFPFAHALRLEVDADRRDAAGRHDGHAREDRRAGRVRLPPYLALPGRPARGLAGRDPGRASGSRSTTRMLPTGDARAACTSRAGPLGDAHVRRRLPGSGGRRAFALEGGGRRIELAFEDGYPYAQVFAPPGDALIAFEPMTAPTNALVNGGPQLPLLEPGERYARRSRSRCADVPRHVARAA